MASQFGASGSPTTTLLRSTSPVLLTVSVALNVWSKETEVGVAQTNDKLAALCTVIGVLATAEAVTGDASMGLVPAAPAVSVSDSIRVRGGTLTLSGGTLISVPSLVIASGTLGGSDVIEVAGDFDWAGGAQSGSGTTRLLNTVTTATLGGTTKTLSARTFENQSPALTWAAGNINIASAATVTNAAGAVWDVQADVNWVNAGGAASSITNLGTYRKSGGTGTSLISSSAPLTNSDSVVVQSGTLALAGGTVTHSGPFTVSAGATLQFASGTHTVDSSITGAGTAWFSSGSVALNGQRLAPGDGAGVRGESRIVLHQGDDAEILLWDLPEQ